MEAPRLAQNLGVSVRTELPCGMFVTIRYATQKQLDDLLEQHTRKMMGMPFGELNPVAHGDAKCDALIGSFEGCTEEVLDELGIRFENADAVLVDGQDGNPRYFPYTKENARILWHNAYPEKFRAYIEDVSRKALVIERQGKKSGAAS